MGAERQAAMTLPLKSPNSNHNTNNNNNNNTNTYNSNTYGYSLQGVQWIGVALYNTLKSPASVVRPLLLPVAPSITYTYIYIYIYMFMFMVVIISIIDILIIVIISTIITATIVTTFVHGVQKMRRPAVAMKLRKMWMPLHI